MGISINSDIGEGYPHDLELFTFIDYANIACGGHAGDEDSIKETILNSMKFNVSAGAHPSYPDRMNFGRVSLLGEANYSYSTLLNSLYAQLSIYNQISRSLGIKTFHIKPHGALYNDAVKNSEAANLLLESFQKLSQEAGYPLKSFPIIVQPNSILSRLVIEAGGLVIPEGFVDRRYNNDGTLTPRSQQGSVIELQEDITRQVLGFAKYGSIITSENKPLPVRVSTICIHSDTDTAPVIASLTRSIIGKRRND